MSTESEAARAWLRYARSDLAVARSQLGSAEVLPETLCFHAQQAVEKAFKADLTAHAVEVSRSHNIGELLDLIPRGMARDQKVEDPTILTDYAVSARYPGEAEPLGPADVAAAADLAEAAVRWAERVVAAAPGSAATHERGSRAP